MLRRRVLCLNSLPRPKPAPPTGSSAIFTRGGSVHMYANKSGAVSGASDEGVPLSETPKVVLATLKRDRGMYFSTLGTLLILLVSYAMYERRRHSNVHELGLVGPRRREFRSRLTVVLDVDETLVSFGDKAFRTRASLAPRPYLAELLDYLTEIDAEVILWSACSDRYMRQVLSVIDPKGVRVSSNIVRDDTWFCGEEMYEKDIALLARDPKNVIIIENRALSVRHCNANAVLVDEFIRGEYLDAGVDYPANDRALLDVRDIIKDLEESGRPVAEYLADRAKRSRCVKEIPAFAVMRHLPDELARGVFYFVGDKYRPEAPPMKTLNVR